MFNHPPRSTTDRNHEKTPQEYGNANSSRISFLRRMYAYCATPQAVRYEPPCTNTRCQTLVRRRRIFSLLLYTFAVIYVSALVFKRIHFARNHKEYINCHTISSQDGIWDTQLPGKLFLGHSVSQPHMSIVRTEEIDISSIRLSIFLESPGYNAATACLGHLGSRVAFNVFPNSKEGALPTILSTTITLHPAAPLPDIRSVPGLEDGHMESLLGIWF